MIPLDDLADLADVFVQSPTKLIGIPFALVGAIFMSLGAQFQHRGVMKVEQSGSGGLGGAQMLALLKRPSWVSGTVMLGLAIVFQLVSLNFSPLILVQPLGAVALVMTSILNSRVHKVELGVKSIRAIVACVGGIALFVTVAAIVGGEKAVTDSDLIVILVALLCVVVVFGGAFLLARKRMRAIFYIVAAGAIYGFVATLAKVIINRVQHGGFEWLTLLCAIGLIVATVLGAYFVQNAYSSGPPDLVIAGLTVIDPLVAVCIGIVVLGEASGAPLIAVAGFIVAGLIAIWGVFQLARHHPQVKA